MTRIVFGASRAAFFVALIVLAGCTSKSTTPTAPTPVPITHMYLSLYATTPNGAIQIYSLPVTAASIPTGTITGLNKPAELFDDKTGRLFVPVNGASGVTDKSTLVYTSPITATSTPAFTLTSISGFGQESATEDASGNVYVGALSSATCCIEIFPGPVSGNATASSEINSNGVAPNGLGYPYGMGFDTSGNMYVSSTTSIIKFTPPISSTSVPAANVLPNVDNYGLLVDASNNLYVANATVDGTIDVFAQPFQNGSARSFGLNVVAKYIQGMAFDGSGDLWCTDGNGGVWEILAPITSTSVATKILTVTNAYGIAFGP